MLSHRLTITLLLLGLIGQLIAQKGIRDTTLALVPITVSYAYQLPAGDMSERFGQNHNIGVSAGIKLRSNYILGVQGTFIFGNKVQQPGLLQNMFDSQGQILNTSGKPAGVLFFERGYSIIGFAGKIIPVAGPNPNSGIMLRVGGGYLRHHIRIETQNDEVPQLEDENLEGYDRLTAGPAVSIFAGYQNFSNNRKINFMFGFEIIQGFTKSLRALNFDTEQADTDTRLDALNGFRFGWTLPIYKRPAEKYYLY
jgi:hypothetical protein